MYRSQYSQDKWVDKVLGAKKGLFVIESGAYDGEHHSNSFFLETERKWECLLIEPNPYLQEKILQLHRKCTLVRGGLSISNSTSDFNLELAGPLSGLKGKVDFQQTRINHEIKSKKKWMVGPQGSGKTIKVPCYTLDDIMNELGRKTIDYWSLDVEGAEPSILANTNFNKFEVGVLTIEHEGRYKSRRKIEKIMTKNGFKRVKKGVQDDFYANPKYFEKHGMQFPSQ